MKNKSVKLQFVTKNSKHFVGTICSRMKNKSVKLPFVTKNSKHLVGTSGDDVSALIEFRTQLYGLGYPRQPSPRATLAEVTFSLFLSKIQPAVYIRIANSSRGARQLGWASCLTSAGRVTLASGTTFLHINALARLTGTSLGVANVT